MSDTPFRFRGLDIVVDTGLAAELDIELYSISEQVVLSIGRNLKSLPQSANDRAVGNFLIREISGFDVVFIVGREGAQVVVTIGRIRPPDPAAPTEEVLKSLNIVAMFRGVTGL
jgi:hypothetical protein